MTGVEDLFRQQISSLSLAGKQIRAHFCWSAPPPLPEAAQVVSRWSHARRRLQSVYWKDSRPGRFRLYWSDAGTFDLDSRHRVVQCYLPRRPSLTAVEEVLRGPVCSFFLLEHGFEPLHAAAVVLGGRCVAFMGAAGAGKSSLVAYLTQHGADFLSDDVLPLRPDSIGVRAYPGLRQLRLAPHALPLVGGGHKLVWRTRWKATLQVPSATAQASFPVARIYLLDRRRLSRRTQIELNPLAPRDAFLALVAHTTNNSLDTVSRLRRQFHVYGQLAATVPVRRLRYPSSFAELARLRQKILADLKS